MIAVDRSRLPVPGLPRPFLFPAIARAPLSSGLDLRVVEHDAVPVVSMVAVVPGGSAADPAVGGNALQAVVAVDGTAPAATMPPTDALGTDATATMAGGTAFAATLLLLAAVAGGSVTVLVLARRAGPRG